MLIQQRGHDSVLEDNTVCFWCQDEKYEHLDELEVMKVEKQVNEVMKWMNSKMNEQAKQSLTLTPVIKACEIQAKTKVVNGSVLKC